MKGSRLETVDWDVRGLRLYREERYKSLSPVLALVVRDSL